MAAGYVQALARQMRRADADVTGGKLRFLRELLEFLDDRRAAREPERQAGADLVVEGEKLQFLRRACDGRASSLPRAS